MNEPKILIAGTGRAGTTLLVQVMTDLGFDTGFKPGIQANPASRAGLEKNVLTPNAPRVVKSPRLSVELGPLLAAGLVEVEHVIIPVRNLDIAAASRVRAAGYGKSLNAPGGMLWGSKRASHQRGAVGEVLAQLMVTVAQYDVPHTLLYFPRFASDPQYTFSKLAVLDPRLTLQDYERVLHERYRPDYVHEQALDRTEQRRMLLMHPVSVAKHASAALQRRITGLMQRTTKKS